MLVSVIDTLYPCLCRGINHGPSNLDFQVVFLTTKFTLQLYDML